MVGEYANVNIYKMQIFKTGNYNVAPVLVSFFSTSGAFKWHAKISVLIVATRRNWWKATVWRDILYNINEGKYLCLWTNVCSVGQQIIFKQLNQNGGGKKDKTWPINVQNNNQMHNGYQPKLILYSYRYCHRTLLF